MRKLNNIAEEIKVEVSVGENSLKIQKYRINSFVYVDNLYLLIFFFQVGGNNYFFFIRFGIISAQMRSNIAQDYNKHVCYYARLVNIYLYIYKSQLSLDILSVAVLREEGRGRIQYPPSGTTINIRKLTKSLREVCFISSIRIINFRKRFKNVRTSCTENNRRDVSKRYTVAIRMIVKKFTYNIWKFD